MYSKIFFTQSRHSNIHHEFWVFCCESHTADSDQHVSGSIQTQTLSSHNAHPHKHTLIPQCPSTHTHTHRTHQVHLGGDSVTVQGLHWGAQHVYLCEQLDVLGGTQG